MNVSRFIARVLGLVGILFFFIVLVTGGEFLERMIELMNDPGYLLQMGIINLSMGGAMVVGHNVWDGSWRVVITVFGYLALLKGIVLLAWPHVLIEMANGMIESGMMPVQIIFGVAIYGWLAWLGFRPEKETSKGLET